MNTGLQIPQNGGLDFVSLGALNHRVDSGIVPLRKITVRQFIPSGGEYNVAANLADCSGLRAGMISVRLDYLIGDLITERVLAVDINPLSKDFSHNGVTGPNIATAYFEMTSVCLQQEER